MSTRKTLNRLASLYGIIISGFCLLSLFKNNLYKCFQKRQSDHKIRTTEGLSCTVKNLGKLSKSNLALCDFNRFKSIDESVTYKKKKIGLIQK